MEPYAICDRDDIRNSRPYTGVARTLEICLFNRSGRLRKRNVREIQARPAFLPRICLSPEDFRLLRQAKRRGVKTAATAKSWDVLTTKAFTRVRADRLLVFNEFNRQEAIALGDYRQENIVVTGFPQFDIYAREEIFMPRDVFMRSIGADPAKRMALIAVPGDWKTPYTQEIMKELDRRIDAGHYPVPLQILARFHPKYPDSSEKLHLKNFIFDRPGTHLSDKKNFQSIWESPTPTHGHLRTKI